MLPTPGIEAAPLPPPRPRRNPLNRAFKKLRSALSFPRSGTGSSTAGEADSSAATERGRSRYKKIETVEFYVGPTLKRFTIHRDLLLPIPYFPRPSATGVESFEERSFDFPDFEEQSFKLFVQRLRKGGKSLHRPTDFYGLQDYLGLYVIGDQFNYEALKNEAMDFVRAYYRDKNMAAPPYRLEYIYEATKTPNKMREFLVHTAAYKMLCEKEVPAPGMCEVVGKGGELAVDLLKAVLNFHHNGMTDARRNDLNCQWHEHVQTVKCPGSGIGS
ncbi:hypothetical protein P152DRAFT_480867 [Eremomyces bilateralis CBS 781.70]|uniref:BTB domain-containing protein n=1 Tax=Eremomyces bilateralis CBS 781.70 TaxID=1392243 RepID=A0A6G1G6V4_9PEZI|nr:uncharacterized protein P152DRAFT_480867 [Eremomyces bilateralis CBS 781.70]KAF1813620.1 hypothetical protein P152DRAFT_480867 [Eremomyces bilateralis CBS 781.70]